MSAELVASPAEAAIVVNAANLKWRLLFAGTSPAPGLLRRVSHRAGSLPGELSRLQKRLRHREGLPDPLGLDDLQEVIRGVDPGHVGGVQDQRRHSGLFETLMVADVGYKQGRGRCRPSVPVPEGAAVPRAAGAAAQGRTACRFAGVTLGFMPVVPA